MTDAAMAELEEMLGREACAAALGGVDRGEPLDTPRVQQHDRDADLAQK